MEEWRGEEDEEEKVRDQGGARERLSGELSGWYSRIGHTLECRNPAAQSNLAVGTGMGQGAREEEEEEGALGYTPERGPSVLK